MLFLGAKLTGTISNPHPVVESAVRATMLKARHTMVCKFSDKSSNFRNCIHRYREWIDDAYEEIDKTESIQKWRRVFGNDFAKGEVEAAATFSESTSLLISTGYKDIVSAAIAEGVNFLEKYISPKLPHVIRPSWQYKHRLSVVVYASECIEESIDTKLRSLSSGEIIKKNRWIRFEARNNNGILYASPEFDVKWQVVNTDSEAVYANQLRGGIEKSSNSGVRWEATKYRGAHWVEAFVISKRDGLCWGRSGRFFVVIE